MEALCTTKTVRLRLRSLHAKRGVGENLPGFPDGAYHNGNARLLGDLEHAAAEVVELAVLAPYS